MPPTEPLPAIIRPNGKLYRPRKLTADSWENEYDVDDCAGCFVFGTHDIDLARPLAEQECRFAFGIQYVVNPQLTWIRDAFEGGERRWVYDAVRGRAAVRFVASDEPDDPSGSG